MSLVIYDTMERKKVPFHPATPGHVGIYVCGPTVYADPHLGHARGPIVYDVLRRYFLHKGYKVRFVSNITDVGHLTEDDEGEDKVAKRAKLEKLEPMEVAEKYTWSYFDAMAALNVLRPSIAPRASGHIPEMWELTQKLLERGVAYVREGSVYFRVRAFPEYGKLSGKRPEELRAGARVEVREEKEDPLDFALWKRAEPGHLMRWKSPWGEGYPGWHIECTAMSLKYLGEGFDLHAGGIDLQFPHHECEIAQAEAAGYRFARHWMHHNHVLLEGEKMAKSTGNLVLLHDLLRAHEPMAVRFYLLQTHYRSPMDFTFAGLEAAKKGYVRLLNAYREVRARKKTAPKGTSPELERALEALEKGFMAAIEDDLSTPEALAQCLHLPPRAPPPPPRGQRGEPKAGGRGLPHPGGRDPGPLPGKGPGGEALGASPRGPHRPPPRAEGRGQAGQGLRQKRPNPGPAQGPGGDRGGYQGRPQVAHRGAVK
jgi:cysteinyl-tRNA synthetase